MTITSLSFLVFNIVAVILFVIFPKRFRWISLLVISLAFYYIVSSSKMMVLFAVVTSLITWFGARYLSIVSNKLTIELNKEGIGKDDKKRIKKSAKKKRTLILWVTLLVNVGVLIVCKIFNFYTDAYTMIVEVLTGKSSYDLATFVLPLGISYYTFSITGYLLDVYWKRYEPENNPFRFILYAVYYPHIMQGPISRYTKLGKELKKTELCFKWDNFVVGIESILLGCFKKLVIADRAGMFVKATLQTSDLSGSIYLVALICDAIQIYSDFSGYMDIVSGVSRLFDVELEKNFNHPFMADSVPDFWRRWHMSLGGWFKDYVYYPISVSKLVKSLNLKTRTWKHQHIKTIVTVIIPVMITWILTGLWHGTGAGYLAWGLYYGILITFSVTFLDDFRTMIHKIGIDTECFSYRLFKAVKIFFVFMGGRFWGNTMRLEQRLCIIKSANDFFDFDLLNYGLTSFDFFVIITGVLILVAIGIVEVKEDLYIWFNKQNVVFRFLVVYLLLFSVLLFGIYGNKYDISNFMYQQF